MYVHKISGALLALHRLLPGGNGLFADGTQCPMSLVALCGGMRMEPAKICQQYHHKGCK